MRRLLHNGLIINEDKSVKGSVLIDGDTIEAVYLRKEVPPSVLASVPPENIEELDGKWILPGAIDCHVHFREPGLTHKADIASENRAAVAGGVTSYLEMPNTKPPTTDQTALEEKYRLAAGKSLANYAFFPGATNDNIDWLRSLDYSKVPGVKVFLGSSTGNMLVDSDKMLDEVFLLPAVIAVHSEDEAIIRRNAAEWREKFGGSVPVSEHPNIRSREACVESTRKAIERAERLGTRLHITHITTADEAAMLSSKPLENKRITAEACLLHLWFTDEDYPRLGTRIKCNPAVKTAADREALREALRDGRIDIVATDHAPHAPEEKQGDALTAASGSPMVQFSLPAMLTLAQRGVFTKEEVVRFMAHNPATLYGIEKRGFIRPGYKADLVIVDPTRPTEITKETILSKCGWSPMEGESLDVSVVETLVNGVTAYPLSAAKSSQPLAFK